MVAIDSVNPSLVLGGAGEAAVAARVRDEIRAVGLEVEIANVAPGRPNVVGMLDASASGRTLILCGHLDTVGVAGMEAPFTPVERGGRVFGRGSQDMKGGIAAIIGAAAMIAARGLRGGRLAEIDTELRARAARRHSTRR